MNQENLNQKLDFGNKILLKISFPIRKRPHADEGFNIKSIRYSKSGIWLMYYMSAFTKMKILKAFGIKKIVDEIFRRSLG